VIRSSLGSVLLRLGIAAGTIALAAFVTSTLLFDPGRPARIVHAMLATSAGRSVVADTVTGAIETVAPGLPARRADALGQRVADDPALLQALSDVSDAHGSHSVTAAVLSALRRADPRVARLVGNSIGTGRTNDDDLLPAQLGSVARGARTTAVRVEQGGLVLFLLLAGAAIALGPARERLVRRLGWACIVASIVPVLVRVALPAALDHASGRWPVIIAAGVRAASTGLIGVFATVLAAGVLLVLGSYAGRYVGGGGGGGRRYPAGRGAPQPGYLEPGYPGLGYPEPGYGGGGYGSPAYGGPGHGSPAYGAPTHGGPGYGTPAYGGPGYGGPAYGEPGYGGPAHGGGAHGGAYGPTGRPPYGAPPDTDPPTLVLPGQPPSGAVPPRWVPPEDGSGPSRTYL
jgi:hypothetical protein